MVHGEGDIRGVSLEGLDTAFRKVVPDFDRLIVASRDHVWLVVAVVVFDEVHAAFFVGVEAEVWCGVGDGPDFDGAVEAGGSKCISVFWVDSNIHNVVSVALEDLECGQRLSRRNVGETENRLCGIYWDTCVSMSAIVQKSIPGG